MSFNGLVNLLDFRNPVGTKSPMTAPIADEIVYVDHNAVSPVERHTPQDLQILIQTYRHVNKHLDGQVSELSSEVEKLKAERDSWKERALALTAVLNRQKKEGAEPSPIIEEIADEEVDALCLSISQDEDLEILERDGIIAEKLIKRGIAASWFIDPNEITLGDKIGEGTFGTTYMGRWHGGNVCIKCIKVDTHQDAVSFYREIEALSCIRHPNILPFLGASINRPDHCWLVCEYMSRGTLSRWLYGDRTQRSLLDRLEHCLSIARGMEACEMCTPPIVHRDLKPSNVFLDGGGVARIGDFGLARRLNPEGRSSLTGETGTYFYMSPEMIQHNTYTSATDIWSWGVLACELLNKSLPYHGLYLTPVQVAMAVSKGDLKPTFPMDIHPKLNDLMESVFDLEPSRRPAFKAIVNQMSEIIDEIRETAQPEGFVRRLLRL
eukprot:g6029.t1